MFILTGVVGAQNTTLLTTKTLPNKHVSLAWIKQSLNRGFFPTTDFATDTPLVFSSREMFPMHFQPGPMMMPPFGPQGALNPRMMSTMGMRFAAIAAAEAAVVAQRRMEGGPRPLRFPGSFIM